MGTQNDDTAKKENRFEDREIPAVLERMPEKLRLLLEKTKVYLNSLGDEVSLFEARRYYSYKRWGKPFAVVIPDRTRVIINLLVDPETVEIDDYFTRDLKNKLSYGSKNLQLQLFVRNDDQFEKARTYMMQAYKSCR